MKKLLLILLTVLLLTNLSLSSLAVILPEKNVMDKNLYIERDENSVRDVLDADKEDDELQDETDRELFMTKDEYKKVVVKPAVIVSSVGIAAFAVVIIIKLSNKKSD